MTSKIELKEKLKMKILTSKMGRLPRDVKEQKIEEIKQKLSTLVPPKS